MARVRPPPTDEAIPAEGHRWSTTVGGRLLQCFVGRGGGLGTLCKIEKQSTASQSSGAFDMRRLLVIGITLLNPTLWSLAAHAQCEKGFQPRGNVCITQRISDYIACIEAAGGNKSEIDSEIQSAVSDNSAGAASGSASGALIKGSAAIKLSKEGEKKITDKLTVKYYQGAMHYCNEALKQSGSNDQDQKEERNTIGGKMRKDLIISTKERRFAIRTIRGTRFA